MRSVESVSLRAPVVSYQHTFWLPTEVIVGNKFATVLSHQVLETAGITPDISRFFKLGIHG
jgi:hypothetical protein